MVLLFDNFLEIAWFRYVVVVLIEYLGYPKPTTSGRYENRDRRNVFELANKRPGTILAAKRKARRATSQADRR